jgi:hypothetical protein
MTDSQRREGLLAIYLNKTTEQGLRNRRREKRLAAGKGGEVCRLTKDFRRAPAGRMTLQPANFDCLSHLEIFAYQEQ